MSLQCSLEMDLESCVKTYVTALEIIPDLIFAGIGNVLHLYKISDKCISKYQIFQKNKIHGIRFNIDRKELVCFGNREIFVASIQLSDLSVVPVSRFDVGDWIWDVKWKREEMTVLCANNTASLWNWRLKLRKKNAINREKCLLYSGIIIGDEWSESIVIGGTMNRTILVWAPSVETDEFSPILQKLTGHMGAIFSLFYHQKLGRLCSTSDDRSARIWNVCLSENCGSNIESWSRASISLMITVYGHISRVWKSFIFDDGSFLTSGEDSQLRIWDEKGKPLCSWITHQGASIRSVSVNEATDTIVTGGGDGGISLWPLQEARKAYSNEKMERIRFSNNFGLTQVQDIPRRIVLSRSGKLFTFTNQGYLLYYDDSSWRCIVKDERFADYCLLQISQDRRCISLASIRGDIMILKETEDDLMKIICDENICATKIFSFHWLADQKFITCCEQGRVEVWKLQNDGTSAIFHSRKVRNFILPSCKERWLTSAVEMVENFVVGDRDGSLHVFRSNSNELHPTQTFKRIHGRLGVSSICYDGGDGRNLFSVGRDGYIRCWYFAENKLHLLASNRLPIKWPVQVVQTNLNSLFVVGFNEVNFEVWDVEERKKLLTFACGGGHRPWDFSLHHFIRFVFIKKETVYNLKLSMNRLKIVSFSKGLHIREIECLKYLGRSMFVSGGEDTTLRIFSIKTRRQSETVFVIRSHVSSIKAISYIYINDLLLVVSAGGRAQMNVCRVHLGPKTMYEELASHMLKRKNNIRKPHEHVSSTLDLEPRHMDICLHRQDDTILIYSADSDAFWRIFIFDVNTKSLKLFNEIEYANFCVLKIIRLSWCSVELVVTFSSDGKVTFWNAGTYAVVYQRKLHQSSINCYDYSLPDNNNLILVTGGDDAVIKLSRYKNERDEIVQMECVSGILHEANVTGVKIVSDFVISASCDQKIILWKWDTSNCELKSLNLIRIYPSIIPDIRGCEVINVNHSQVLICVYGHGFEVLTLELKHQNCISPVR